MGRLGQRDLRTVQQFQNRPAEHDTEAGQHDRTKDRKRKQRADGFLHLIFQSRTGQLRDVDLTGRRKAHRHRTDQIGHFSAGIDRDASDIADKLTDDRQVDHRIQLLNDVSQHDRDREDQQGG